MTAATSADSEIEFVKPGPGSYGRAMSEITFTVERCEDSGALVAS